MIPKWLYSEMVAGDLPMVPALGTMSTLAAAGLLLVMGLALRLLQAEAGRMSSNRWQRFADWDARPLRLDRFARENPEKGFSAMKSPADPAPGVAVEGGRVTVMDGVAEADFDMIDRFIAAYHLDPAVAVEAMAIPSLELARRLVDMSVPRGELVRLAHGLTPARLAEVVGHLSALEIAFAYSKMRARRTPGNQAHVTNAKDDPLQLAADAAIAVGLGFDEIETTQRVARNAWSNALACAVGASVGRWGTLFQCASEEAEELQIAMAGFTSYAETVSVYGSEGAFIDGDDTPWSKGFLAAAYASRGVKMRATSGAGSELLMGFHQAQSMLYLEARCLCLQRAMGVQGTQNGGIDGAPVTMTVPGGARELMAENLIAVWLDLECASGNDARPTESEIRVGAKIMPFLVAGSDLICSGFGSILKYDNSFNPSLAERRGARGFPRAPARFRGGWRADAARRGPGDGLAGAGAGGADARCWRGWGSREPTAAMRASVAAASGSNDTASFTAGDAGRISAAIQARGDHGARRDPGAGGGRVSRGGGEPAGAGAAAAVGRLPADLGAGARRAGGLGGQRSQRLCRAGHRLPGRARRGARRSRGSATCSTSARCCGRRRSSRRPRRGARAYRLIGTAAVGRRRGGGGGRDQPGLRDAALSQPGRAWGVGDAAGGHRGHPGRRRRAAGGADAAHRRHLVPGAFGGGAGRVGGRDRAAGQGDGGDPPRGAAAASQPGAFLQRADHRARRITAGSGSNAAAYARGERAGAGGGADARRGDGRAVPCGGGDALCDRDRALRAGGGAGGDSRSTSPRRCDDARRCRLSAGRDAAGERARAVGARRWREVTLDAVLAGDVTMEDLRIDASALRAQAEIARAAGRRDAGAEFRARGGAGGGAAGGGDARLRSAATGAGGGEGGADRRSRRSSASGTGADGGRGVHRGGGGGV